MRLAITYHIEETTKYIMTGHIPHPSFSENLRENTALRYSAHVAVSTSPLSRMEKRELVDVLQGQIARANTRLRSLQSQCERLELKEAAGGSARPRSRLASNGEMRRPSTCPALPATCRPAATRTRRQRSECLKAVQSAGGVDKRNGPMLTGRKQGRGMVKSSARVVWAAEGCP